MPSFLAPLFAQALSITLADDSELRARFQDDEAFWDAITRPSATLAVGTRRTAYTLTYAPELGVLGIGEPDEDRDTIHVHNLNANATTRFKLTTLNLNQSFSWGRRNFALEVAPTGLPENPAIPDDDDGPTPGQGVTRPTGQQGAPDSIVTVGSSTSSIGLGHELSRRVTLSEYASYTVSGGMNEDSRSQYPQQQTVQGGTTVGYRVAEYDTLSTGLNGDVVYTDPDTRSILVRLDETWTRTWFEGFITSFGTGISYSRTDTPERTVETLSGQIGPVGNFTVSYTWGYSGASYTLTGNVGSTPEVDRFTGAVDPRVFWSVTLTRVAARLALQASALGAHSVDVTESEAPLSTVGAALTATYDLTDEWQLRSGASASTVLFSEAGETDGPIYTAFVGFRYVLPIVF